MLNGVVSLYSNSPNPTGYGEQSKILLDLLKRDGADVAMLSNYGLEGNVSTYETAHGPIPHYPRGVDGYSNDVAPLHHSHFKNQHQGKPDLLITLYDVWVLQGKGWEEQNVASWVPLDHVTMPPKVQEWLRRDNVTPIAMAPHGVRQMESVGIECEYVPHSINTEVFKPTDQFKGQHVRDFMKTGDKFVVGMVAANKASGLIHRKCFSENLLAFSMFYSKHPDAVLYLHTDPLGTAGGWNLLNVLKAFGIPKEAVIFPNFVDFKYGINQTELAALYTGMDVLLAPSYGEGFGVPTLEAAACGVRVIGSGWAATPDLISEDGWLVEGQPMWDAGQDAIWQVPLVPSIVGALEEAYNAPRGTSKAQVEFAQGFAVEKVWQDRWLPTLNRLLV